jgi:ParB family chromosome partitioning protein
MTSSIDFNLPSDGLDISHGYNLRGLPVDCVKSRPTGNVRDVDHKHVLALMEDIDARGLINPITVDRNYVLVLGMHRFLAQYLLALDNTQRAEQWGRFFGSKCVKSAYIRRLSVLKKHSAAIIVRVLADDAQVDLVGARSMELADNVLSKKISGTAVQKAFDYLMSSGYVHVSGRPRKDEKAIIPMLARTLGVSRSTAMRLVNKHVKARAADGVDDQSNASVPPSGGFPPVSGLFRKD